MSRRLVVVVNNCPNVERITAHGTRHSHAVSVLCAGVDLKLVSGGLGHAAVAMTRDVYGQALPERHRQAGGVFGRIAYRRAG